MAARPLPVAKIPETALQNGGLAEIARRVTKGKERILVIRRGRPAYAIVPVADLEALTPTDVPDDDEPEAALDFALAFKAEAESIARGEKLVTRSEAKKLLGF